MISEQDAYHELCAYTLAHALEDPSFIHQQVVDAYAAQRAAGESKPIAVTFALVGLYLHVERGFSGRQVQLAHMRLAREKRQWPTFLLPGAEARGSITALDVVAAAPGAARDRAIDAWCASVWQAFAEGRQKVVDIVREHGIECLFQPPG